MIAIGFSEHTKLAFQRLGLPSEDLAMWWGALAALQRADDEFALYSPGRRTRLDAMSLKEPSELGPRDKAFYAGLLVEAAGVIEWGAAP